MANHINAALYSPYGAYELKAKYQRNFLMATASMVAFVILFLIVVWGIYAMNKEDTTVIPSTVIKTIAELGPPPTVAKRPPQVQVQQPNVAVPKVGIPVPVADEQAMDDDVVLATKEELADIVAPDISAGDASGDITVDITAEEYLPAPDEFVAVEIQPEMIHEATPEYPRLAKQAQLEGVVWVKALVDKDGNVRDVANRPRRRARRPLTRRR